MDPSEKLTKKCYACGRNVFIPDISNDFPFPAPTVDLNEFDEDLGPNFCVHEECVHKDMAHQDSPCQHARDLGGTDEDWPDLPTVGEDAEGEQGEGEEGEEGEEGDEEMEE